MEFQGSWMPTPLPFLLCSKPLPLNIPKKHQSASPSMCVCGGGGAVVSPLVNGTLKKESLVPPATGSQLRATWNWVPGLPLPPCVTMSLSQMLRALQFYQLWSGVGVRPQAMLTGKWNAARGDGALVRNAVLGERDVQGCLSEALQAAQKQDRPLQPCLPQSPSYPQHSSQRLWLFSALGR